MLLDWGTESKDPVKRRKQMIVDLLTAHKGGRKCGLKWESGPVRWLTGRGTC